jgi:hypothetical protein
MTTRLIPLAVGCALALAACSKEATPAPAAAKKEDAKPDAGRPMPPAAPTAAPAEGDNAAKKDEPKK